MGGTHDDFPSNAKTGFGFIHRAGSKGGKRVVRVLIQGDLSELAKWTLN